MIWAKVTLLLLLVCALEVLPLSLRRDPEVLHFDEVDYPEEPKSGRKSHEHAKVLLLEEDIPVDSQIYDEPPKKFKILRPHCPDGQLMDHRGRCRQIW
uniref:Secreted protein n=1 Tax=Lutzomyia longipalpis TaxID=7200 RepID=A0A1B0CHK6_LUTLO